MLANGDDPTKVDDASFDEGARPDPEGGRLGPDPPVHRQRLHRPAREGRPRGGAVAGPATSCSCTLDNPNLEWNLPETGGDDLDRQHADPEGRRRLHGVDVHELRLPARDRRADRGVRQLRLAGEGREGGDGEARPGPRRQPARSSRTTTRSRRSRSSTPKALNNQDYNEQVAGADRQPDRMALPAPPPGARRPTCCSRRGSRGSRSSSSSRSASSAYQSLQSGLVRRRLRVRLGLGELLGRDLDRYHEQFIRSLDLRRASRRLIALVVSYPLAYWIAFRGGRWKNLFLLADHRAVLRHVPDPDARLADDPRRRAASSLDVAAHRRRSLGDGRPAARDADRRRRRASPTTSCPSWRCRSTWRSSRSTRGCSRRRRISTRAS